MPELTATLVAHHKRLGEVAGVLARNGLAAWVPRGAGLLDAGTVRKLQEQAVGPGLADMSEGERLRNALTELGTTWVKFGQMLSLRPDVVGADVATELEQLQAAVPADLPGTAERTIESDLGQGVADLYASFEGEPFASGSVARCTRPRWPTAPRWRSRSCTTERPNGVHEDLELMAGRAAYLEAKDPELAQLRPTILIDEFAQMMQGAMNLAEELDNLQRVRPTSPTSPTSSFPSLTPTGRAPGCSPCR